MAKSLQNSAYVDWEETLPLALFATRTAICDSTSHSAYFLVYGRLPLLAIDTFLSPRRKHYGDSFVPLMMQELNHAFNLVAENTKLARERYKAQADKNAAQITFKVGDPVYLYNHVVPKGLTRKHHSPWLPYFRIVEMVTSVNAKIRSQATGQVKTVHVNDLRFANIYEDWDIDPSNHIANNFPAQMTHKKVAKDRVESRINAKSQNSNNEYDSPIDNDSHLHPVSHTNTDTERPHKRYCLRPLPGRNTEPLITTTLPHCKRKRTDDSQENTLKHSTPTPPHTPTYTPPHTHPQQTMLWIHLSVTNVDYQKIYNAMKVIALNILLKDYMLTIKLLNMNVLILHIVGIRYNMIHNV